MAASPPGPLVIDLGLRRLGHQRVRAVSADDDDGPLLDRFALLVAAFDADDASGVVAQ